MLTLPMFAVITGLPGKRVTDREITIRAEQVAEGARCIHCSKEISDISESTLLREGKSRVRVHNSCIVEMNSSLPVDWERR